MKQIHVRRHAPKHATGTLTEDGKILAKKIGETLPSYTVVMSSPRPRAVETAELLTGVSPTVDSRAGTPVFTEEQEHGLHLKGQQHAYGIAGAIFEIPEYRSLVMDKGKELAKLIEDVFALLPEDGTALVISHDGVMVAADMVLRDLIDTRPTKTYQPLEGFIVYENGEVTDIVV